MYVPCGPLCANMTSSIKPEEHGIATPPEAIYLYFYLAQKGGMGTEMTSQ